MFPTDEREQVQKFIPTVGLGKVFESQFDLGKMSGSVMSYGRAKQMEEFEAQGPKFTPEEIYEKHGIRVDSDTTERAAFYLDDLNKEEEERQAVLRYAPQEFLSGATSFAGSMAGAMTDPADFALGYFLSAGLNHVSKMKKVMDFTGKAGATATLAQASKIAKDVKISRMADFANELVANTVAQTANEAVNMYATQKEQKEYTVQQAMQNIMIGSLGFTTVIHGGGALMRKIFKAGDDHIAPIYSMHEMLIENGKDPSQALKLTLDFVGKKMEITDDIAKVGDEIFADKKASIFDEAEDLIDIGDNLRKKLDDGEISPEEAEAFVKALKDAGVEDAKIKYLGSEKKIELNETELAEISKIIEQDEYDMAYNARAKELYENTKESIDAEAVEAADIDDVDAQLAETTKRIEETDNVLPYVKEKIKKDLDELSIEQEKVDMFTEIAKCEGIAINGK